MYAPGRPDTRGTRSCLQVACAPLSSAALPEYCSEMTTHFYKASHALTDFAAFRFCCIDQSRTDRLQAPLHLPSTNSRPAFVLQGSGVAHICPKLYARTVSLSRSRSLTVQVSTTSELARRRMQGRNCQTVHRLLSRWQLQSSEALVTHQACLSSPAVQRLSSTASQTAPAQSQAAEPQSGDTRIAQLTYTQNLRDLRRKWQEQRAQKLAAKAKADAVKNANKAKMVEAHRRNLSAIKEIRMQIHEEKRRLQMAELAQRQAIAAQWRSVTGSIYTGLKEKRRHQLLQESRDWITLETLADRIQEALDNPVPLYKSESQHEWHTSQKP